VIRERILHWAVHENSKRWLPKGVADYGSLLRGCDEASQAAFTSRYGADKAKWVWGAVNESRFGHPLAAAPLIGGQFATPRVPLPGSGQTPNVASGVSMRHISSPGNWDATRIVIPLGQSGDPKSLYFKDQFDAWTDRYSDDAPIFEGQRPVGREVIGGVSPEIVIGPISAGRGSRSG
jgi:hypothetical protein